MNSNNRMTKIMLKYRPNERKRLGRPLKRLLDEAGAGILRPKLVSDYYYYYYYYYACVLIVGFVVDKVTLVQIFL
jgi:hypothetical protein